MEGKHNNIEKTVSPKAETEVTSEKEITKRLEDQRTSLAETIENQAGRGNLEGVAEAEKAVQSKTRQFVKKVAWLGLGLSTAGALNEARSHIDSRYEVTETKNPDGTISYSHEDPETKAILDYMTGKAELPEHDKVYFYKEEVGQYYRELYAAEHSALLEDADINAYISTLPDDSGKLVEMAIDLKEKRQKAYVKDSPGAIQMTEEEITEEVQRDFNELVQSPGGDEYNPNYEQALWRLQKEVGAPKIRWIAPGMDMTAFAASKILGDGRAFYMENSNTVYISPLESERTLLAEDAHADQFNRQPVVSRVTGMIDFGHTAYRAVRDRISYHTSQLQEYGREGSLEHQAHSEIEPGLKGKLILNMDRDNMDPGTKASVEKLEKRIVDHDYANIRKASEAYKAKHGRYPLPSEMDVSDLTDVQRYPKEKP